MNRFVLALLLGAALVSSSAAQVALRDSSAVADTTRKAAIADSTRKIAIADTTSKVPLASDTTSKRPLDSLSVRVDTTIRAIVPHGDTTTVQIATTHDTTQKRPSMPGLQGLPATAASLDPNGYRDARWGAAMKDVHDYLVDHDNVDEYEMLDLANGFEYDGSLAGTKCRIAYQFDNDRLFAVRVTPKIAAVTKFEYLDSFDDYEGTLESKYGKPSRSGFHKVDESYLNTIESIQLGFAKKYALWEFERSYIVLVLLGHKGQLELHLTYISKVIFDEMSNRIESLKLEDF